MQFSRLPGLAITRGFGRVWRGSNTLGELIVASPARRRQRPSHPRLSHLSSSCLLLHATPAACFGIGRTGNSSTTTIDDGVQAWPTVRLQPAGTTFPHGPSFISAFYFFGFLCVSSSKTSLSFFPFLLEEISKTSNLRTNPNSTAFSVQATKFVLYSSNRRP